MEVVMHRFVLAEFNTHRVFSRNSASSRAIPVKKQLQRVIDDPALPLVWPSEKSGMQGGEPLSHADTERAKKFWLQQRDGAIKTVRSLVNGDKLESNLHKSVANRLLEPYLWHVCVVTATEWDNFFGLRCNPLAQPEIQAAAYAMRDALQASTPYFLDAGEWHLPYIQEEDNPYGGGSLDIEDLKKISAARCARVSYLTQDGVRDPAKDIELCDRLTAAKPPHASPLEHVATPCNTHLSIHDHLGNFVGWDQMRHEVIEEDYTHG